MSANLTQSLNCTSHRYRFVRQLRRLVNLTQAQFAEKLGVSVPTIARWESNRSQPLPLALMQLKAMLYDLKESHHKLQKTALKLCW
jgi:putative transcriptional regulator